MHPDLQLVQGSWIVTALEMDGQNMPAALLADSRIVVQGQRFTSTGVGAVYEGTLELDASATPRRLDMKFDAGPEKGNINLGIYELAGDTWKLCLATRGSLRPPGFATTPGSGFALETLARAKAGTAAPKMKRKKASASTAPATEFEGEWQMVSGMMNGQAMEESVVVWVKRVTRGNRTTVYAGPQVMMQMDFTNDSAQSPKTIDYRNTAGANRGKNQYGIYEFEGSLLRICVAAPGNARPSEFQSAAGDGRTMTVWKRA